MLLVCFSCGYTEDGIPMGVEIDRCPNCGIQNYNSQFKERLARLAHEQWSGWMEHLFERGVQRPDGVFCIDPEFVARWRRQMKTPYDDLPEHEKESDRHEANRVLREIRKEDDGQ
jgi:hypothetical protein